MPVKDPNRYRDFPASRLDTVTKWSVQQTFETGAFQIRDQFLSAVRASLDVNAQVRAFAAAFEQLEHSSRTQLAQVHDQVARMMQQAVVSAYEKALAGGRNIPAYRAGGGKRRDAGGALLRALSSHDFYRGTPDGIGFINTTLLDTRARQWHRLNFGAGSAGNYTPTRYDIKFGNLVAASFGFSDEEPSKAFLMPKGVWSSQGAFYPGRSKSLVVPTRGIRSWNFLDVGIKVLGEQLGPHYEDLYKDWYNSAQRGLGPLSRVGEVPPPRRGAFSPADV